MILSFSNVNHVFKKWICATRLIHYDDLCSEKGLINGYKNGLLQRKYIQIIMGGVHI